jgi:GxxExxY protein
MLTDQDITQAIIGAAITVHKSLGPGFLEAAYEEAFAIEFTHRQIPFERQKTVPVFYRDQKVAEHRLDFLVSATVVVELKAVAALEDIHFAVVRSYLKATGLQSGLLLNFATMPLTIKRVGREDSARRISSSEFLIS